MSIFEANEGFPPKTWFVSSIGVCGDVAILFTILGFVWNNAEIRVMVWLFTKGN